MPHGLYVLLNTENQKYYIGSTDNLQRRKQSHFNKLKCNGHDNKELQEDFNVYGEDAFLFIELDEKLDYNKEQLREKEIRILNNSQGERYNVHDLKEKLKYVHLVSEWKDLYKQGLTLQEIGKKYNIGGDIVKRYITKFFPDEDSLYLVEIRKDVTSENTKKKMSKSHLKYSHLVGEWQELYRKGMSCRAIGKQYNLHQDIISKYLKKYFPSDIIIPIGRGKRIVNLES